MVAPRDYRKSEIFWKNRKIRWLYVKPIFFHFGNVATKDIPANVVVIGNPCRVKYKITEKDKSNFLDMLRWIKKYWHLLVVHERAEIAICWQMPLWKEHRKSDIQVNKIEVSKLNISRCKAFEMCWTKDGACVQCDDMAEIEPCSKVQICLYWFPLYTFMEFRRS